MSIQITLNANEFTYTGTYEDRSFTSLRINRISNGRIYFTTINNGMKMSTMIKQMQLVNGEVVISFGKSNKLIIGTYVDDSITSVNETVTQEVLPTEDTNQTSNASNKEDKALVDTFTTNQYIINLYQSVDQFSIQTQRGNNSYKYHVTYTDINTNQINTELSDIIYLSLNAAMKDIKQYQHKEVQSTIVNPIPSIQTPKEKIMDILPEDTIMYADHAKILFKGKQVEVLFTNHKNESITATFKYRKAWSNRKYIDTVFNKTNIKPSWQFTYGWDHVEEVI